MLGVGLEKPVEFFPKIDPKSVYINIDPPEGADLDYVDRILRRVEIAVSGILKAGEPPMLDRYDEVYIPREHRKAGGQTFQGPGDIDNVEHIYSRAVQGGSGFSFDSNLPNHIGIQFLDFEDRITPTAKDVEKLRRRVKNIAGARITVDEQKEGPPTGAPINIEISGDDFQRLGALAEQVKAVISKVPFVGDIRDDYVAGLPSVRVRIDRQKAALFGLSTDAIGLH